MPGLAGIASALFPIGLRVENDCRMFVHSVFYQPNKSEFAPVLAE
jgi:hypothetical protein